MSEELKETFTKIFNTIKEPFEKIAATKEAAKDQKTYTVEVECIIPAKVRYKVVASSPEEAAELVKGKISLAQPPLLDLNRLKKISAKVFDYGTTLVRLARKL
jgi:hypothetical protein